MVNQTNATTNFFLLCGGHDDDSDCMAKGSGTKMLAASFLKDNGTMSKMRLRDKQDTLVYVSVLVREAGAGHGRDRTGTCQLPELPQNLCVHPLRNEKKTSTNSQLGTECWSFPPLIHVISNGGWFDGPSEAICQPCG